MKTTRLHKRLWNTAPLSAGNGAVSRRFALRRLGAGGLGAGLLLGGAAALGAQDQDQDQDQDQNAPDAEAAAEAEAGKNATAGAEDAALALIEAVNAVLAGGDTGVLDALVAPGYVDRTPRRSAVTGRLFAASLSGLKASLIELRSLFVDAALNVDEVIAAGDRAAVRFGFAGTPDSAVPGALPEGGPVTGQGVLVFRVAADGRVVESWTFADITGLAAAPPADAASDAPADAAEPADARAGRRAVVREERDVSGFTGVALEGIGTLTITQGEVEALTIEAEARILPRIGSEVRNGRLTIAPIRSFRSRRPISYELTVIQLDAVEVAGSGRIEAAGLTAGQMRLAASGSGGVAIGDLTANGLEVAASGSGTVELAGVVDTQRVDLSGASGYAAADLASRTAVLVVEGAARAIVRAEERLEVRIGGAGAVEYLGDPVVTQEIGGAGTLTKVG